MGGKSMKDVGGAGFAGRSPPFLGRERAAVNVGVGPERRSPRYHETCLALKESRGDVKFTQNGGSGGKANFQRNQLLISMRPGLVACSGTLHRKTSQAPRTSIHRWNRSG